VIKALLDRHPHLAGGVIDEVIFGNANGAGEDNRNLGRMAGLLAGLPVTVRATTVNRLCGSSLDAAMIASRSIETGDAEITMDYGVFLLTDHGILARETYGMNHRDLSARLGVTLQEVSASSS
jgi:acetyl-CoA acyltransferase